MTEGRTDGLTWVGRKRDGPTDGWTNMGGSKHDGRTDGRTDRRTHSKNGDGLTN